MRQAPGLLARQTRSKDTIKSGNVGMPFDPFGHHLAHIALNSIEPWSGPNSFMALYELLC